MYACLMATMMHSYCIPAHWLCALCVLVALISFAWMHTHTTCCLCGNFWSGITACLLQRGGDGWDIRYLPLRLLDPVPSDIEVARSQTPKKITELAKEIGLLPSEVRTCTRITCYLELVVCMYNRIAHFTTCMMYTVTLMCCFYKQPYFVCSTCRTRCN